MCSQTLSSLKVAQVCTETWVHKIYAYSYQLASGFFPSRQALLKVARRARRFRSLADSVLTDELALQTKNE